MPKCKEKDCIYINYLGQCEFLHKKGESRIKYAGKSEVRACAWYENNSGNKCDKCKNAIKVEGHVQKYCVLKYRVLPLGRTGCEYFKKI
ncbi:MAG: hypothetical protein MJZ37_06310 [Bacilli bacterium]|nr:hypothetical protein [Bacilli bacterium]